MCKHIRTTVCCGIFPKGTMIAIHQCDMCGYLVWRIDTSKIEEDLMMLPVVDAVALASRLEKTWKEIMAQPFPTTRAIANGGKPKTLANHDNTPIKAKDVKREENGDALWA